MDTKPSNGWIDDTSDVEMHSTALDVASRPNLTFVNLQPATFRTYSRNLTIYRDRDTYTTARKIRKYCMCTLTWMAKYSAACTVDV